MQARVTDVPFTSLFTLEAGRIYYPDFSTAPSFDPVLDNEATGSEWTKTLTSAEVLSSFGYQHTVKDLGFFARRDASDVI